MSESDDQRPHANDDDARANPPSATPADATAPEPQSADQPPTGPASPDEPITGPIAVNELPAYQPPTYDAAPPAPGPNPAFDPYAGQAPTGPDPYDTQQFPGSAYRNPPMQEPPYGNRPVDGPAYGSPEYGAQFGSAQYGDPRFGTPQYGEPYGTSQFSADPFGVFPTAAPLQLAPERPQLGQAFNWTWNRFTTNIGVLIGGAALWAAIIIGAALLAIIVIGLIAVAAFGLAVDVDGPASTGVVIITGVIVGVAMSVIGAAATSCWLNGLITIADGKRADLGDFFRPVAFGPILAITLIISAISAASELFLGEYLGVEWISLLVSVLLTFLTIWMVYFAADTGAGVGAALNNGLNLATGRAGPTLVVLVIAFLITIAGMLALLVGLLFAVPFAGLLTLYYFRALTRRPIAQ